MKTRLVLLFSFMLLIFINTTECNAMPTDEFEELRNSIRLSYADSPLDGLKFVNALIETTDLTLEQKIIVTNYKAWFLLETEQLESAMETIVKYMNMVSQSNEKDLMYGYFNISGGIYARLGLYEEALAYYRDAMPFAQSRDERLVYQTENNIALIKLNLKRYTEAAIAFEKYRDYAHNNKQTLNESFASNNLALALIGLKQYPEALNIINQAMRLQTQFDYTTHLAASLILKGKVLRFQGLLAESESVLNDAFKLIETKQLESEQLNIILCLAQTYEAQGNTDKALDILASVESYTLNHAHFETQLSIAKLTAELYEQKQSYAEALSAYKQYSLINEAILTRQAKVNLAKALAEADVASKEVRISELTRTEQIKATKADAFKDLTIVVSICLVVILFGSFIAINSIDKQKQTLAKTLEQLSDTQNHVIEIEKIASLTALVSGMAHQLNTPIGTIVTASSLIDDYMEGLEEKFKARELSSKHFHKFITDTNSAKELVISSINRLAGIVEEFKALNVSIHLDKPMSKIQLPSYLKHRLAPYSKHLGKQIEFKINGDEVAITSYPTILSDVLKTLVINSCEHGFIHSDQGVVEVTIKAFTHVVEITYQDNGVGINDEILHEIFTPFYTTNLGGNHLGLGLNVVFNAVKYNLRGKISAESCKHGARFVISLPIDARLIDDTSY
ncbi:ATP-binding protein [Pseudoalteromonas gelatinilytica]